jgi:hypothetical protein
MLQSTVGGFSAEFMRKLPRLEQVMIAHGLEPSDFVISKDRATPAAVPFIGPFFCEYSVFVGEESFTVTEPTSHSWIISTGAASPRRIHRRCRLRPRRARG